MNFPAPIFRWVTLSTALWLAACGNSDLPGKAADTVAKNCEDLFRDRVQPRLAFCTTCHVPGGIGDVADGQRFMLSQNDSEDFANLRASWERLGRNDAGPNLILTMAAGTGSRSHTGGTPWPAGSEAYKDMESQLNGFASGTCAGGGAPVNEQPLLGSKHARHLWASFCEGKADDAALPTDPRQLVQPGANAGRAVHYNGWWENCHVNLPASEQHAKTCGEYRARRDRGRNFLMDELPTGATPAADYNNTWQKWGLTERPANFDAMYTLRYGLNAAPFDNPYPLPGEDPNATHGGSGRLPLGLRQSKDADGKWTGQIANGACFSCHGGQIGDPDNQITVDTLGLGNNNYDVLMSGQDNSEFNSTPAGSALPAVSLESLFNIGIKQRGQNNAVGAFELLITILDLDSLGVNPNLLKNEVGLTGLQDTAHPLAHTQDTPPWWNMGSRPRKFFDAGVSNDSTRIIMAAGSADELVSSNGKPYRDRIEQYDQDLEAFFLSLRSPEYPRAIDTALAEQGAVLFHTKNLWAEDGNASAPKPAGGNGSCASCHGAYSPRYVNDPTYLESPVLEGVASHISPLEVIGTDRARSDMLTPTLRNRWDATYWGYTDGVPGWTSPDVKDPFTELADDLLPVAYDAPQLAGTPLVRPLGVCNWQKEVIGYQAPPLYGVWATAPYFHNGSVPTVEQVLDSGARPPIWRRMLQTEGPVTGFDQNLDRAYDFERIGWQHDVMTCAEMPGTEAMNCNPVDDQGPSLVQIAQNLMNSTVSWLGLVTIPDPAADAMDKRFVYDSRILGNGNGGHAFSDVLTDAERRAVIEYLKTL